MRKKRRMTVAEFAAVRPLLKISKARIEAAHSALVDGETLKKVGDQHNWSRQAVNHAVNVVWRTFESYRAAKRAEIDAIIKDCPPGWGYVSLCAESLLIDNLRKELALNKTGVVKTIRKVTIKL